MPGEVNMNPLLTSLLPEQEKGIKPSCALPYELYVDGQISDDKKGFELMFSAENKVFGKQAAGSAFTAYIPSQHYQIEITDNAYKNKTIQKELQAGKEEQSVVLNLSRSHHWYDFSIRIKGMDSYERRYAGHVETGKDSFTDPAMGGIIT